MKLRQMFSILKDFFKKLLLNLKLKLVSTFLKNIKTALLAFLSPLFAWIMKKKFGREIFYKSIPENNLLITKTKEGLFFIVHAQDSSIGKDTFVNQIPFESDALLKALEIINFKKKVLIDIGANIGTVGIFAISNGLFDRCYAIEPEPENFKLLKVNVELNKLSDKFKLFNQALSNEIGDDLYLEISKSNSGDHRIRITEQEGLYGEHLRDTFKVETNTLDNIINEINLDECLVFMDTQGFEGHVLSGGQKIIKNSVPMVTEFWPYGLLRSNGMKSFYESIDSAEYSKIYDLRFPEKEIKFSKKNIEKIHKELGESGRFTDLLFIKE